MEEKKEKIEQSVQQARSVLALVVARNDELQQQLAIELSFCWLRCFVTKPSSVSVDWIIEKRKSTTKRSMTLPRLLLETPLDEEISDELPLLRECSRTTTLQNTMFYLELG